MLSFCFIYITLLSDYFLFEKYLDETTSAEPQLLRICLALSLAPLGFLGLWPFLTPSYGSVAFIGLIIFSLPIAHNSFDIKTKVIFLQQYFTKYSNLYRSDV